MTQLNDMLAPKPVMLPVDPVAQADGSDVEKQTKLHPESPLAWAMLCERALESLDESSPDADLLTAYALARTGYHRGLDRLRGNGWKGFGSVPWDHEPNQGVLRAIACLARAAKLIGEDHEYDRCRALLSDCDPASVSNLLD